MFNPFRKTPPRDLAISPHVERLATLMDSQFKVPGLPIRFGYDAIIGLVPVVGDSVTVVMGAAMLMEARRLRLGWDVRLMMVGNLVTDWLIGLVPVADVALDVWFKAHKRNLALLREAVAKRRAEAERAHAPGVNGHAEQTPHHPRWRMQDA
jgi:hypothetical protein